MLRYFKYGLRSSSNSSIVSANFNWCFFAALKGPAQLKFSSGKPLPSRTNRLWLVSPKVAHAFICTPTTERAVLHFTTVPTLIEQICLESGYLEVTLTPEDVVMLRKLVSDLNGYYQAPTPASLLFYEKTLFELSLLLIKDWDFKKFSIFNTDIVERVEKAIKWYMDNIERRPTMLAVADAVHVSVAHLRRHFQQVFNQSPAKILTRLSLEKATQILVTTSDSIESTARQCGFESGSAFCRIFQKHYNCSPNIWRHYASPAAHKRGKYEHAPADPSFILNKKNKI